MREDQWLDDVLIDRYINKAVRAAHRKIVRLYEDYFLASTTVTISADQDEIDFPSDLYANKLRSLIYFDGSVGSSSVVSEFSLVKNLSSVLAGNLLYGDLETQAYHRYWMPSDESVSDRKIKLFPQKGQAGNVLISYIRRPVTMAADTDICPILEFSDYVLQKAKELALETDSDPRYTETVAKLQELEQEMLDTLSNRTITDDSSEVSQDLSFYGDSV